MEVLFHIIDFGKCAVHTPYQPAPYAEESQPGSESKQKKCSSHHHCTLNISTFLSYSISRRITFLFLYFRREYPLLSSPQFALRFRTVRFFSYFISNATYTLTHTSWLHSRKYGTPAPVAPSHSITTLQEKTKNSTVHHPHGTKPAYHTPNRAPLPTP